MGTIGMNCPKCDGDVQELDKRGEKLFCKDCSWDNLTVLPTKKKNGSLLYRDSLYFPRLSRLSIDELEREGFS